MRANIHWEDNEPLHTLWFKKWYDDEDILTFEFTENDWEQAKINNYTLIDIEYTTKEFSKPTFDFFDIQDTYEDTLQGIKKDLEDNIANYYDDQISYYKQLLAHFEEEN